MRGERLARAEVPQSAIAVNTSTADWLAAQNQGVSKLHGIELKVVDEWGRDCDHAWDRNVVLEEIWGERAPGTQSASVGL